MSTEEKKILRILLIFYMLLLISYMILLIIQGFKNKEYNAFNSIKIVNERFLYEQISYEIYNSINSPLILDLKIQDECEENYQPLNFLLKINPYYNYKSTMSISHLFNKKFCIPIYKKLYKKYNSKELRYDNLLMHSINIDNIQNYNKSDKNSLNNICEAGYKPCGILDTMNNILCLSKKYNCPLNDMIISENNDSSLIDDGYEEIDLNNSFSIYLNTKENIETALVKQLTASLISITVLIILFIVIKLILLVINLVTDIISKLPVINKFDKLGGIIYGVLEGLLIVYGILALCLIIAPFIQGNDLLQIINNSNLGSMLYNNNILLKLIG